jgi:hypothetical protein
MRIKQSRFVQTASIAGVAILMMAVSANAGPISYTTNSTGTQFVSGGTLPLVVDSTGGVAGTLTFVPNTTSNTGVPSNIDLGDFLMACPNCTTSQTTIFSAFTFDLVVDDTTDNATGEFIGTSTGGTVSSNSSTVQINWQSPLQIGPGTSNVLSGNFGMTFFDIVSPTSLIVAPNSGSNPGDTTIQGQVNSTATPEPATFALVGGALIALGLLRRKHLPRR